MPPLPLAASCAPLLRTASPLLPSRGALGTFAPRKASLPSLTPHRLGNSAPNYPLHLPYNIPTPRRFLWSARRPYGMLWSARKGGQRDRKGRHARHWPAREAGLVLLLAATAHYSFLTAHCSLFHAHSPLLTIPAIYYTCKATCKAT